MADVQVISDGSGDEIESGDSSDSDLEVLSGVEPIAFTPADGNAGSALTNQQIQVLQLPQTAALSGSVLRVSGTQGGEQASVRVLAVSDAHTSLQGASTLPTLILQQQPDGSIQATQQTPQTAQHAGLGGGDALNEAGPSRLASHDQLSSCRPRTVGVPDTEVSGQSLTTDTGEEEGQCCPICFEDWTNSGDHRLVSLKCGHLFGQSCINKWLKGQGGKCPQCNVKAKRKDVRVIYAKTLKVADTSEHDAAVRELAREREARKTAELQAAETRLLLQLARDECKKLSGDIERQRQQLNQTSKPCSSLPSSPSKVPSSQQSSKFIGEKTLKICEAGGCRVMAYCAAMSTLCISQPSPNPLFPGFGLKKLSALDLRTSQYVSIHSKMIRDVAVNPYSADNVVLTASVDKTVAMTNLVSNTVIHRFTCPMPVWSCVWNSDDKNYFFAGMQNGTVFLFDTRNTTEHIQSLNTEGSRSPVVSLQYVRHMARTAFSAGGLLVGQLDRSVFYESTASQEYKLHLLPLEGNLTSMCVDDHTGHILATFRPTQRQPSVRHVIYELYKESGSCGSRAVQTFHGGSTQKLLARSRLLAHPSGSGGLVVAGDEASQCVHIWDVRTGLLQQKLPVHAAAIDVIGLHINEQSHLVALTDKQICTAKWG